MSLRRQAIKLAASLPQGAERTAILQSVAAADKEVKEMPPEFLEQQEKMKAKSKAKKKDDGDDKAKAKKKDDGKMPKELLESFKKKKGGGLSAAKQHSMMKSNPPRVSKSGDLWVTEQYSVFVKKYIANGEWADEDMAKKDLKGLEKVHKATLGLLSQAAAFSGKKASHNILASFRGADGMLAREVVKLASRMPAQRTILLDTLRQAAGEEEDTVKTPGWDATEISEVEGGPLKSDSDEPYMSDEFTQQEFHELGDLQESGQLSDGSDEQKKYAKVARAKTAATKKFRSNLIRIASGLPKGSRARQDMLHLLAS